MAGAAIEQQRGEGAEAEAVACAGRDDDAVEAGEFARRPRDIDAIAERDALVRAGRDHARDVAVERVRRGDHLLKQRRLAGETERTAWDLLALEHRDRAVAGD